MCSLQEGANVFYFKTSSKRPNLRPHRSNKIRGLHYLGDALGPCLAQLTLHIPGFSRLPSFQPHSTSCRRWFHRLLLEQQPVKPRKLSVV